MNDGTAEAAGGGNCIRCGYDLTGLGPRARCPECGLLCGLSRLSGERLAENHPRWLRRLARGAFGMAAAIPMSAAVPFLLPRAVGYAHDVRWISPMAWRQRNPWSGFTSMATLPDYLTLAGLLLPTLLVPLLFWAGCIVLASRSGRTDVNRRENAQRWTLRLLPVVFVVAIGLTFVLAVEAVQGLRRLQPLWLEPEAGIGFVTLLALAANVVLLTTRLRTLAR